MHRAASTMGIIHLWDLGGQGEGDKGSGRGEGEKEEGDKGRWRRWEEGGGGEEEGGTIRVGKENKPSITMMAVPGACSLGSGSPLSRGQSCPPWRRGWNGCQGD